MEIDLHRCQIKTDRKFEKQEKDFLSQNHSWKV